MSDARARVEEMTDKPDLLSDQELAEEYLTKCDLGEVLGDDIELLADIFGQIRTEALATPAAEIERLRAALEEIAEIAGETEEPKSVHYYLRRFVDILTKARDALAEAPSHE